MDLSPVVRSDISSLVEVHFSYFRISLAGGAKDGLGGWRRTTSVMFEA